MKKVLLTLSILVLSGTALAQESPTTPRAEHVQITQGPEVPLVGGYLTVIRWTVNNPGGAPVHYGVVHYGTNPKDLNQTAKNPIRFGYENPCTGMHHRSRTYHLLRCFAHPKEPFLGLEPGE